MSQANSEVRRATVEDLASLRSLWAAAGLSGIDMEKRFAEFQVVQQDGKVVAAMALQIAGAHARLHSEVYRDAAAADDCRGLLWTRLQSVARNHGLARLWTQHPGTFWTAQNFVAADAEVLARLPAVFGTGAATWLTLKLKDEPSAAPLAEREFELFKQAAAQEREAMLRQARTLKRVAVMVTLAILGLIVITALLYFRYRMAGPSH